MELGGYLDDRYERERGVQDESRFLVIFSVGIDIGELGSEVYLECDEVEKCWGRERIG